MEVTTGYCGAYTVLRYDFSIPLVSSKETKENECNFDYNDFIWGKEYHMERLRKSFIMLKNNMNTPNNLNNNLTMDLRKAENMSIEAINILLYKARHRIVESRCLPESVKQVIKIFIITLLWTPSPFIADNEFATNKTLIGEKSCITIHVHGFCNNIVQIPEFYNPRPISATIALPQTLNINHKNLQIETLPQ